MSYLPINLTLPNIQTDYARKLYIVSYVHPRFQRPFLNVLTVDEDEENLKNFGFHQDGLC